MREPQGRDAAPDELGTRGAERLVVDTEGEVPGREGVGAEHVDGKRTDEALQESLPFGLLQIDRDRLLAHIGSHEVAVTILACDGTSDVAIGISAGTLARPRCPFQPDDAPPELHEPLGGVGHGERLFYAEHDTRLSHAHPVNS
jgi:hypothetical protein